MSEDALDLAPDEPLVFAMKAALRKRLRTVRAAMPQAACARRSAQLIDRLLQLQGFAEARAVALFFPMLQRREVDLRALDEELKARKVQRYYPAIDAQTRVMTFRLVRDLTELQERGLGFAEPEASAQEATTLDWILTPCLAVAPDGMRLGYGGGFYDRTLPRFVPPARSVAVAYDHQLLVEVPHTARDVKVQHIITDRRTLHVS